MMPTAATRPPVHAQTAFANPSFPKKETRSAQVLCHCAEPPRQMRQARRMEYDRAARDIVWIVILVIVIVAGLHTQTVRGALARYGALFVDAAEAAFKKS